VNIMTGVIAVLQGHFLSPAKEQLGFLYTG
jgi:hypothetical protein